MQPFCNNHSGSRFWLLKHYFLFYAALFYVARLLGANLHTTYALVFNSIIMNSICLL